MKSIILLFVGIVAMIIPAAQASAQLFPIQYSQVPNTATIADYPPVDPRYMTFEQFMQFMMLYKDFFGQNIDVKKVYKEYHDDDDDNDHDHKDRDHKDKWWKNDKDRDNKKKYCEGKGHWNGKTCVTNNEKDKEDWRDAVCDGGSQSKFCGGNGNKDKDKDDNDDDSDSMAFNNDDGGLTDDHTNDNNNYGDDSDSSSDDESDNDSNDDVNDDSEDSNDNDDGDDDSGGDSDDSGGDSGGDDE